MNAQSTEYVILSDRRESKNPFPSRTDHHSAGAVRPSGEGNGSFDFGFASAQDDIPLDGALFRFVSAVCGRFVNRPYDVHTNSVGRGLFFGFLRGTIE